MQTAKFYLIFMYMLPLFAYFKILNMSEIPIGYKFAIKLLTNIWL